MAGYSFTAGSGSCNAALVVDLDPWDKRNVTADEVAGLLKKATDTIPNASFMFFGVPTIMGLGMSNGVELKMQDRTGGDINTFYQVVGNFLKELQKRPEVMMAMTTFNPNFPQKLVEIDVDRTKRAGLGVSDVLGVLQTYVGGSYVSNFNSFGKQYRVVVQASPERRARLDDLQGLMVKTSSGEMAPITEFLSTKDVTGPQSLNRFNLYSSMDVTIIPNYTKGYTSSDVNKLVGQIPLPTGYGYAFSGMSREEVANSNQIVVIFLLCAVFVYLLLAALYESYILPLAVMLSFPIGLSGVLLFVFFSMLGGSGIVDNIYVQISLVMLIGLLAKNGILIVEYALQRRRKGMDLVQSAIEGATARLRPILMTSFAFIFGLLPLALANGAGAVGNRSIGISAVGGMLVGTVFGVVVIPVLFVILQGLQERLRGGGPAAKGTKVTQ
jgi:HAE1 family hydrophobic/amphiphilic exporter-1